MATHPLPLLGRGLGGGHGHMRPSFSGREKTTQACWTTREKAAVHRIHRKSTKNQGGGSRQARGSVDNLGGAW